jgi:hypothetical protein
VYIIIVLLLQIGYSECFNRFWGSKSYHYTQILFFCCILCLNVSSIVDTAQVVDTVVGHLFSGGSGAIHFQWIDTTKRIDVAWVRWDYQSCTEEMLINGDCVPFFDQDGILFSVGYAVVLLIFMPMALMDLKASCSFGAAFFALSLAGVNNSFFTLPPSQLICFCDRKTRSCKLWVS